MNVCCEIFVLVTLVCILGTVSASPVSDVKFQPKLNQSSKNETETYEKWKLIEAEAGFLKLLISLLKLDKEHGNRKQSHYKHQEYNEGHDVLINALSALTNVVEKSSYFNYINESSKHQYDEREWTSDFNIPGIEDWLNDNHTHENESHHQEEGDLWASLLSAISQEENWGISDQSYGNKSQSYDELWQLVLRWIKEENLKPENSTQPQSHTN